MKKLWLPIAIGIFALLSTVVSGCIGLPSDASVGELLHPSGNPLAHRFSDTKDIRTATSVVAASDSSHPYQADYRCDGVGDEVQINAALNSGGRTILLEGEYHVDASIIMPGATTLEGQGLGTMITPTTAALTVIRVGALCMVRGMYISGDYEETFDTAIWVTGFSSIIDSVYIEGEGDVGIALVNMTDVTVSDCYIGYSIETGVYLNPASDVLILGNYFSECTYSIYISAGAGNVIESNVIEGTGISGCTGILDSSQSQIIGNSITDWGPDASDYGIVSYGNYASILSNFLDGGGTGIYATGNYSKIVDNEVQADGKGIDVGGYGAFIDGNDIASCATLIYIDDDMNTLSNNKATNGAVYLHQDSADLLVEGNIFEGAGISSYTDRAVFTGNLFNDTGLVLFSQGERSIVKDNQFTNTGGITDNGTLTTVEDTNEGLEITEIRMYRYVENTSGGALAVGDVVSLKSVAAGNEITTPVAVGEVQVYGMVAEIIANNEYGLVLVKGYTTVLKSTNAGGGNILIGDFLITENGVRARKNAAATDPIFARALEACAAADCTIDAYINSPWD